MNYYQIVFSPTGGTQKVTEHLTSVWPGEVTTVDLCDRQKDFASVSLDAEDLVAIAVPSYGGRVPALAAQRLSAIRGNGARAVIVAVYGNRDYDDTLVELEDLAKACDFKVIAAVSAVAQHSMIPEYGAGRPDKDDAKVLKDYGSGILDKVQDGNLTVPEIPGNRPYKGGMKGVNLPLTNDSCIDCKLCAESCPAGAIDYDDVSKIDPERCISCWRCVAVCPVDAKYINPESVKKVAAAIREACSLPKENELFI